MVDNSIVIVRGENQQPELLSDDGLQQYIEDSEPETSATRRMLAVVLLWMLVAAGAGILGLIAYLARL